MAAYAPLPSNMNDRAAMGNFFSLPAGRRPTYIGPDIRNAAEMRIPAGPRPRMKQPPAKPTPAQVGRVPSPAVPPTQYVNPDPASLGSMVSGIYNQVAPWFANNFTPPSPGSVPAIASSIGSQLPPMPVPAGHMSGPGSPPMMPMSPPSAPRVSPPVPPPSLPFHSGESMDARYARGGSALLDALQSKPFDQRVDEYNAANPVAPRMAPPVSPQAPMPSAPYGYSPMPGVVTRSGVSNMVGVPTQVPAMDAAVDARAAAEQARKAAVASRVNAGFERQLADNADTLREWGVEGGQNFIGGKRYTEGGGMRWKSNSAIAREQMTPEQLSKYDAAKAARDARAQEARQLRFARAQFQGAAQGTGVMFNPDGGVDVGNTMAVNAYARNPQLGMAGAIQQQELAQKAAQAAYAQSPEAHTRAMELAGVRAPVDNAPIDEATRIQNQLEFSALPVDQQAARFYATGGAADPAKAQAVVGVPDTWLQEEYARLHENPNWFYDDEAQVQGRELKKRQIEAEMQRRGLQVPKLTQQQPFFKPSASGQPGSNTTGSSPNLRPPLPMGF